MRFSKTAWSRALFAPLMVAFVCAIISSSLAAQPKSDTSVSTTTASTQKTATPATPDANSNPVLAELAKAGAKFFFIGEHDGLQGWLIVKDHQVQIAYVISGTHDVIIGAIFGPQGENLTAQQVQETVEKNKDIVALVNSGTPGQEPVTGVPLAGADTAAHSGTTATSPGEQLMRDLASAHGVTLGSVAAPDIFMVMDPNCPHCKATWRGLRDFVLQNKLQMHMVPIGMDEESERAAAVLLHAADPLSTWDKYVAGDKTQLAGTPDPTLVTAVQSNHAMIDSWHIDITPWLVYRDKTGQIKIIKGEVKQPAAILSDISP